MLECPIDYFEDNLIFGVDKSCWAIFEIKGFDYDMLSDESKIAILNRLTLFIANISEAKFMIIPISQDLDSSFKGLVNNLQKNDPLYESAVYQAGVTKEYLKEMIDINGKCNDYKSFVAVKLIKIGESELVSQAKDAFEFIVASIIRDFNAFMNIDTKDIRSAKVNNYKRMATQIFHEQTKRMELIKTDTNTVQWILRRMMFRGLQQDVKLFHKTKEDPWIPHTSAVNLSGREYIRPRKREMVNLFSGVISKVGRSIKVEHNSDTSYQTFLTITNIPNDLEFPDCEWIYLLQQRNLQAEIYIHVRNIEHREAIRKIDFQRRAANSQIENIQDANAEIPDDLLNSKDEIDALEAELKAAKLPLCQSTVTICISDNSYENLEEKANMIKREYEDINFIIERPLTDQIALFMHCIPSVGFVVQDFIMRLTPMSLASGLIGATHELGDLVGAYIGKTGLEQKNVFLDLRQACLSNTSASTVFYGNLGVGKSFNANLITYLHVMYGAYGLIIDPKGERTHWTTDMESLKGMITLVTLAPDRTYKGTLDPFNIFRDSVEEAAELATNLLSELFKINPKDGKYTALLEALNKIKSEKIPSMMLLSDILHSFPEEDPLKEDALLLSRQIRLLQNAGMSQLLIGDGTEDSISLDNRLNILQVQNLKLPSPDTKKEDYTQEENISTVLMMVITAFARKFVHSHKNNFKVILFDESWMLGKTVEGEKLMSYVARMSRSLYTSMILNGHSVTDLPNEGIRNSITYKFCFKTGNVAEAERMLDFLKLEKTKDNIQLIMSLGNAQCLFQDLNGRVGVLKFDAVFDDLIKVFSTTPVDASNINLEETEEIEETEDIAFTDTNDDIDIFSYELR